MNRVIKVSILAVLYISLLGVSLALDEPLALGSMLPNASLVNVEPKQTVELHDLNQGKALVVMFIATGCPYSNAFNEVMEDLAQKYRDRGVVFVGVNSNKTEPFVKVKEHAKANGFSFMVTKDDENRFADAVGAVVTPEVYLTDDDLVLRYHGAIGNSRNPTTKSSEANGEELAAALEDLLAGRDIKVKTTKMFGCTIKR
jgi:thiol-disulfide isomerase/thioredoxin